LTAQTQQHLKPAESIEESIDKMRKASLNWAKLIARIYEINPLLCTWGKELKIVAFVTHPVEIQRILSGIGWSRNISEFDPPYIIPEWDICQLLAGTEDGFASDLSLIVTITGPDPPFTACCCDPPHWEDDSDPPHWED
jgi:hypothetical protein